MLRLAAVALLLVMAACGSDPAPAGTRGADGAVTDLLSSLESGSCAEVKKLVVTPDAIDCEQIGDLRGSYADDGVDLGDIAVTTDEVNGSSATVAVDLGTGDDDQMWQAERVDGSWLVLFDSVD